jgi:hypothetical protein
VDWSVTLSLIAVFTTPISSAWSAFIYFALCFPRAFAFTVLAFRLCMVCIKFIARQRTPVVSPKFGLMASDKALEASTEHKETSTKWLEESHGGQPVVDSMEAA